jgi:hydroxymethylpyrimidine/phosphomethylpyrimidine kinase
MHRAKPSSAFRVPRSALPVALTIAGSDSGGGAGVQADLKTFEALGAFGTSAITCITAQNPDGVAGVAALDPAMVALQIRTVCAGFPVAAAKTGMLYAADLIQAVARTVQTCRIPLLVVDPVMVATSGARLLREDAVAVLCRRLLPRATVITPNLPEAEILWGRPIRTHDDQRRAARELGRRFGCGCVVKGGHMGNAECGTRNAERGSGQGQDTRAMELAVQANQHTSATRESSAVPRTAYRVPCFAKASQGKPSCTVVDVLYWRGRLYAFAAPRVPAAETHGTGCTFSAALTAGLAHGLDMPAAVRAAQRFVVGALRRSVPVGWHAPLCWRRASTRS